MQVVVLLMKGWLVQRQALSFWLQEPKSALAKQAAAQLGRDWRPTMVAVAAEKTPARATKVNVKRIAN